MTRKMAVRLAAVIENHYWKEVVFAIAHAAVVVGGFSLLLELPHITNFVVRELGNISRSQMAGMQRKQSASDGAVMAWVM